MFRIKFDFIRNNKYILILISIFIAYNSLFLNKAFHIDDHFTIAIAKAVNENFFVPAEVFFDNPIFLGYYYAPIVKLFGETEIWLHIFYLPFPLLVIFSMYFLSRRFADGSLLAVMLLICTPAFIVMSQNIMLDIPLFGFFLASLTLFIYGVDQGNYKLLILSGILASVAILTKYSGLMLIPLLLIYSLIHSKKRFSLFLLIPVFIFSLWNIHNIIFYRSFMFLDAAISQFKTFFLNGLLSRTFALLSFLAGTSIVSLFLSPFLLRDKLNVVLFSASILSGLCVFSSAALARYLNYEKIIIAVFSIFSFFIISVILKIGLESLFSPVRNKDKIFLSLWFFMLLIFIVCSNFLAARFILLLFPPMLLLIYGQISADFNFSKAKLKRIFIFPVLITLSLSTILALGDYYFAEAYRDIPRLLKENMPGHRQVYFYFGDWGYDYYMIRAGYQPLTSRALKGTMNYRYFRYKLPKGRQILTWDDIKGKLCGDNRIILVVPREAVIPSVACGQAEIFLDELSKSGYSQDAVGYYSYYGNVILMNSRLNAGFYSDGHGILPFSIFLQKTAIERFDIYSLACAG